MSKFFTNDFRKSAMTSEVLKLPPDLQERFDVLEQLSSNDHGETYLLTDKSYGKKYMLRTYFITDNKIFNEAEILKDLNHSAIPRFETETRDDKLQYVIREFATGIPLDKYIKNSDNWLNISDIIDITDKICDVLTYIHSQTPPVIHRDVKPSNIIINPDDKSVKLIDFGISRKYSKDAKSDTMYFGTKEFSPPEQYGYAQTDNRTDIYALGTLLRYMLTGTPDGDVDDKRLMRIINKCTAFSPDDRYKNAAALKKDLSRYRKGAWFTAAKVAVFVLALCAVVAAGVYVVTNTDIFKSSNPEAAETVTFVEPFIEQIVRHKLEKDDNEPILPGELGVITQLVLYETDLIDFFYDGDASGVWFMQDDHSGSVDMYFGTLSSLNDLPMLYNLRHFIVMGQPIRDLSPLAECIMLGTVELFSTPVTDASPLAQLNNLRALTISDCGISDYSFLSEIDSLRVLYIENMPLGDLNEIAAPNLRELSVQHTNISTLDGFERFPNLETIIIMYTVIKDYSPLDSMPNVRTLYVSSDMGQYLHTLTRDDIDVLTWNGHEYVKIN